MRRSLVARRRLTALFLIGMLLFYSPLITLFDRQGQWLGVPRVYLYMFGAWGLLIGLAAWIVEGRDD
jgi:uncharacterized membrane protein (DUF485 family)